jgi:hypothetical protein
MLDMPLKSRWSVFLNAMKDISNGSVGSQRKSGQTLTHESSSPRSGSGDGIEFTP